MWFFWVFALVPVAAGVILLYFDYRRIAWQEVLGSTLVAFIMAGIFQLIACHGLTADVETWSGYATQARQFSTWQEYYEYAVYRTEFYTAYHRDSKGRSYTTIETRQVFDHWEPTSRWHNAYWEAYTTLKDVDIEQSFYNYLCSKFNDKHAVQGERTTWEHNSRMIGGDPNDYVADNRTGWVEPCTTTKSFENRIKAAPSLFSFPKVPTNITVYAWPETHSFWRSERELGTASTMIDPLKWDQLNAVLGAVKKINLIVIGFPAGTSMDMAKWQEAKWVGGKKNDVVVVFSGGSKTEPAQWAYVFGWTEKAIVKIELQEMFTQNPINDDLLPKITEEVRTKYEKKNWHKFDYIKIEPPVWSYWVYFLVMSVVQVGLYMWFHFNEFNGDDEYGNSYCFSPMLESWSDKIRSYFPRRY